MAKQLVIKGADFSENCIINRWTEITERFIFTANKAVYQNGVVDNSSAYQASVPYVDILGFSKIKILVPKLRTTPSSQVRPSLAFYSSKNQSDVVEVINMPVDTSMETSTIVELTIIIPPTAVYMRTTYWADHSQYVDVWKDFTCFAKSTI